MKKLTNANPNVAANQIRGSRLAFAVITDGRYLRVTDARVTDGLLEAKGLNTGAWHVVKAYEVK